MVALGVERTIEQDPAFAVRIMVDIAIRALSPAVNDPTTAVQVLDHLEDLLRLVGQTDLSDRLPTVVIEIVIVAIVGIGAKRGAVSPAVGASLIGAGMASVLAYPLLATRIAGFERGEHSGEADEY